MKIRTVVRWRFAIPVACIIGLGAQPRPVDAQSARAGGAPANVSRTIPVSLGQFRAVYALEGRWRLSGGGAFASFPVSYEEYATLDDSTLVMRASRDSTFSAASDSTFLELRAGTMRSRPSRGNASEVVRIAGDTIEFGAQGGDGTTLIRMSGDHWRVVAGREASGPGARYFDMRRVARAARPSQRSMLLDSLATVIRDHYVFAALAPRVAQAVGEWARSERFSPALSAEALADELTHEVRALMSGDRHFRVLPPRLASDVRVRSSSRGAPPGGAASGSGDAMRARTDAERRSGHYFRSVERLPGNVARIAFDQFPYPSADALASASAIMQLAASADAIILDLRINPGGTEGLNQFIASHFFEPDTQRILYSRYQRRGDVTLPTRVLESLPGTRIPRTPLYILVSDGTGSAAENLTYTLQQHRRAIVVGGRTAGAANSSQIFALPDGFAVQVPIARVIHPVTQTNWEGTGVAPDVSVAPFAAPDTAYALALRELVRSPASEAQRLELEGALKRLEALAAPLSPSAVVQWQDYVGRYGTSEVRVEEGRLVTQAFGPNGEAGAVLLMSPRGGDDFVIIGLPGVTSVPVQFVRDSSGQVTARKSFSFTRSQWTTAPRSP